MILPSHISSKRRLENNHKVLVIIPAHNEAASIANVISDVRSNFPNTDVVVVDDGSIDNTGEIALECGAELLQMPFNLGIGSTMQTGFKFAHREGYAIAVQVDGDGQHDASFLPALVQPIIDGECDLVLGSRYITKNSYSGSSSRRAGTAIFSKIISYLLGQKITDSTSGFRALNRDLIELFADDYPRDYPEVEVLLLAHVARQRIKEIPVSMRQRSGGRSSINYFRSIYYVVKVFLALLVGVSRPRAPWRNKQTPDTT